VNASILTGKDAKQVKIEVIEKGRDTKAGTGGARAGYASSPVWSGGGVVFGPKPRDYTKKVPKSVKRLAFLKALSARIIAGDILVTYEIKVANPKTKEFVSLLKTHTDAEKILVISTQFDEATYKAARNVRPVRLNTASEVNTEQLLAFQKIIVTNDALAKLAERLA
jgi:large subunit ribosomal protein L4